MSKTQTHQHHSTSLAAAFMAPPPVKKQQQQQVQETSQENNNNNKFVRHNSSQSDCEDYYNQEQQAQQQQEQQFTEQIQGPTFIPVFPSFKAILPHHNSSAKGQVPWSCSNCNNSKAFGHKCQQCHKSRDAAALRVFMGQLTKEGDVQLIIKMLEVLCPRLDQATSLLHIEPHTHANTGRGKGCAWVYVSSLDDVLYLVNRLHKRTYPTVNAQTGEVGFVAFPESYSNEEVKSAFDNDITFLADHVVQLFHRSPITAEVPLSLQRALNLPANNNNNNNKNKNYNNTNNNNNNVSVHNNNKPAATVTDNNNINNMKVVAYAVPTPSKAQVQQQQQQQVEQEQYEKNITTTSSPFKRYRWNPYAMSGAARVPTRG